MFGIIIATAPHVNAVQQCNPKIRLYLFVIFFDIYSLWSLQFYLSALFFDFEERSMETIHILKFDIEETWMFGVWWVEVS